MPYGDMPSETCQGNENPRPLAVSVSVFSARRVVESPKSMLSHPPLLATSTRSRASKVVTRSAREVADGIKPIRPRSLSRPGVSESPNAGFGVFKAFQSMSSKRRASSRPRLENVCLGKRALYFSNKTLDCSRSEALTFASMWTTNKWYAARFIRSYCPRRCWSKMYSKQADDGPKERGNKSFLGAFADEPRTLYVSIRFIAFVVMYWEKHVLGRSV